MPSKYPSSVSDLYDLIVEGLGYKVSQTTATELLMTLIVAMFSLGVCPSCHSPNDMTLLLITSNVHDQETMTIN